MTTATLPDTRQPLDWNRAFALGVAIAINAVALGALAVMQPSWQPAISIKPADQVLIAEWLTPPPVLPDIPVAPTRATVTEPVFVPPATTTTTPVESVPIPVYSATAVEPMESTLPPVTGASIGIENVIGVPATRDAGVALPNPSPPPYPIASVRKRHVGTVLLEVWVDANGAATDVRVLKGSGHRELDRSARDHVLRAWSFQPALRDGVPVAARVRIPIEFSLATR